MKLSKLTKSLAVGGFGLILLAGAQTASAQNRNEEYREWQQAQRRAQEEYRDYQRTGSRRDYRDWQQAQRQAQQEYNEYQRSSVYNNNGGWDQNDGRWNQNGNSRWYRINRGGRYYQTDSRGVELLRQAVNSGYQQGYNSGVRDRRYGRGDDYYYNDSQYRTGVYGYRSYVDRSQYQYYFQQGFERGYRDGYNSQYRYGYRSNSGLNILGNVLSSILQLTDQ